MKGHHRYALVFDDGSTQFVTASGPTEAVLAVQGACASADGGCGHRSITDCRPRPHTITDLTALREHFGRPGYGLRKAMGLDSPPTVEDDRPLFLSKVFTGGPA